MLKKPNPKIFNHALAITDTTAERSVMIGDNLEADIEGAQKIGMHTIFFNYHNQPVFNGTISISKLIEIKQHL